MVSAIVISEVNLIEFVIHRINFFVHYYYYGLINYDADCIEARWTMNTDGEEPLSQIC